MEPAAFWDKSPAEVGLQWGALDEYLRQEHVEALRLPWRPLRGRRVALGPVRNQTRAPVLFVSILEIRLESLLVLKEAEAHRPKALALLVFVFEVGNTPTPMLD